MSDLNPGRTDITMQISRVVLACTLTLATSACAGRTAYWETQKGDASGDGSGATADAGTEGEATESPAMAAWAQRLDEAKTREAIALWEAEVGCSEGKGDLESRCGKSKVDAASAKTLANLTHGYYFLADSFLRDKEDEYLETMDQGVWWGERALAAASPEFAEKMAGKAKFYEAIKVIGPEAQEAAYWYAASLGKWAKRKSFAVLLGQKDNIKATMERVLEIDPKFFHGAGNRYFGAYYSIAPAFAGGDLAKSQEHFDKSLAIADYYLGTKVLMAEHLATKEDDEDKFRALLQEVIDADPTVVPELEPESRVEQQKAKELLENIDEYF